MRILCDNQAEPQLWPALLPEEDSLLAICFSRMARVISRPDTEVSQVNPKGISCETQAMIIVISD
jgi:hypothetical protein